MRSPRSLFSFITSAGNGKSHSRIWADGIWFTSCSTNRSNLNGLKYFMIYIFVVRSTKKLKFPWNQFHEFFFKNMHVTRFLEKDAELYTNEVFWLIPELCFPNQPLYHNLHVLPHPCGDHNLHVLPHPCGNQSWPYTSLSRFVMAGPT